MTHFRFHHLHKIALSMPIAVFLHGACVVERVCEGASCPSEACSASEAECARHDRGGTDALLVFPLEDASVGCTTYPGHPQDGCDLATRVDTLVGAPITGVVSKVHSTCPDNYTELYEEFSPHASCNGGAGNRLVITSDDGVEIDLMHLHQGGVLVADGTRVCAGQLVARSGSSGRVYSSWGGDGAHLHVGARVNGSWRYPGNLWLSPSEAKLCVDCLAECDDVSAPEPTGPCIGLANGDYCGSSPSLQTYDGSPSDLVTCAGEAVGSVAHCASGCQLNPPGQHDTCAPSTPPPSCGNQTIDAGEQCDGTNLQGASCTSLGFDGGSLSCGPTCAFDAGGCCVDACDPGSTTCDGNQVKSCVQSGACGVWIDGPICSGSCNNGACVNDPGPGCQGDAFSIQSGAYPSFVSGCAIDNGTTLKVAAQLLNPSLVRFRVRKSDGTAFGAAATLRLYVGSGPTCGNPGNIVKATQAVVVGASEQVLDLTVDPYGASWPEATSKTFWVGKSESVYSSARATGAVTVYRQCAD